MWVCGVSDHSTCVTVLQVEGLIGKGEEDGRSKHAPHHTIPHHTIPHHSIPHYTTPQYTTPHHTTPRHTTLHHTTPHHITPHHSIPHYTTPHHTTLHYTIPHHSIPHYTTPHYTTLHYTIFTVVPVSLEDVEELLKKQKAVLKRNPNVTAVWLPQGGWGRGVWQLQCV